MMLNKIASALLTPFGLAVYIETNGPTRGRRFFDAEVWRDAPGVALLLWAGPLHVVIDRG